MDYKYIEQLLERYWECETTLEEESILRSFFMQKDVPAHLMPYKDIFDAEQEATKCNLSDDFEERVLSAIQEEEETYTVKAHKVSLFYSLRPFYKAAAMVAFVLTLGMAANQGFHQGEDIDISDGVAWIDTTNNTEMPEIIEQTSASLPQQLTDSVLTN